ncbi:hypothetical protein FOQG_19479 [Fusarium oxysporum f. sp. raphani 54005]|uniref:Uncharacterized protein n=1 Tax=Fusarium oxysporum f. sp. raphani 54005 TaxID=1089458 RepID=X0BZ01_FUSOX|nr:hypothetical protein FOQG_19479 [Fusarium oxysporum f. sp. raphani 54005]
MAVLAIAIQSMLSLYQREPSQSDVKYANMVYFVNWYGSPNFHAIGALASLPQAWPDQIERDEILIVNVS